MPGPDAQVENQKRNIEASTGRSFDAWVGLARASGLEKHGELMAWLKTEHGLSHGNANLVALSARRGSDADRRRAGRFTDAGPKAAVRPLHDAVIAVAKGFGSDIELAPKQAYVSLRRSKQFATVGPASGGRLEVGLNLKAVKPLGGLADARNSGAMRTHRGQFVVGRRVGWRVPAPGYARRTTAPERAGRVNRRSPAARPNRSGQEAERTPR